MDTDSLGFWMTLVGTICWGVCFRWMHQISAKQNHMLDQLREQAKRIESFSKAEHDLIKEVHPQVSEIKKGVEKMVTAVEEGADKPAA
jgi:hypothetical protein